MRANFILILMSVLFFGFGSVAIQAQPDVITRNFMTGCYFVLLGLVFLLVYAILRVADAIEAQTEYFKLEDAAGDDAPSEPRAADSEPHGGE